jgi:hypothetical protein
MTFNPALICSGKERRAVYNVRLIGEATRCVIFGGEEKEAAKTEESARHWDSPSGVREGSGRT